MRAPETIADGAAPTRGDETRSWALDKRDATWTPSAARHRRMTTPGQCVVETLRAQTRGQLRANAEAARAWCRLAQAPPSYVFGAVTTGAHGPPGTRTVHCLPTYETNTANVHRPCLSTPRQRTGASLRPQSARRRMRESSPASSLTLSTRSNSVYRFARRVVGFAVRDSRRTAGRRTVWVRSCAPQATDLSTRLDRSSRK